MAKITNADVLRALYAEPSIRARRKQLDRLDEHCRRFIELSPFFVLSSSNGQGHADVSPRGGPPGFLEVVDDHTLLLPDRPGNNRLDTLVNLLENPEVSLLFLVPGVDEVLRVGGTAEIVDDEDLRQHFLVNNSEVSGKLPKTVVRITVREAFLHCAKAVMRARLWDPEARVERASLPTMGQMLKDQIQIEGPAEPQEPESQENMVARYKKNLY